MPKTPEQRRQYFREYAAKNRERLREKLRAYSQTPEWKAKMRARSQTPEWKAKMKEWARLRKERMTPEQRAVFLQRQRERSKEYRLRPDYKEKQKARLKKWRSNPENRKRHAATQRAWRTNNPEKYRAIHERRRLKARGNRPDPKTLPFWKRPLNPHWPRPIAEAMRRLGWTVKQLAEKMGMHPAQCSGYLNQTPIENSDRIRYFSAERMDQLQRIFAEAGEYVDVLDCWPQNPEPIELPPVEPSRHLDDEDGEKIQEVLQTLSQPRLREVIGYRFFDGLTLEQAGDLIGVTRERIRQMEAKALRELRHPTRIRQLDAIAESLGFFRTEIAA